MTTTDGLVNEYASQWERAGVRKGDVVLLHSALKPTLLRDADRLRAIDVTSMLFDSFLEAVGPKGTMIYPCFNFGFSNGEPYDIRTSPSKMGALSEYARQRAEFRTGHAIYSFVAFGAQAESIRGIDNVTAYGVDSPFEVLKHLDGKIAVLNLPDQHSMTFYHHVEQLLEVPYRFHKNFTNAYIDMNGRIENRTYSIYVRDLDRGVRTRVDPMGELLWAKGLYSGDRHEEGCGLRVIRAQAMFDAVAEIIRTGRAETYLYSLGNN